MLFRTLDGKLIQIEKSEFLTDKQYYSKVSECYKNIGCKPSVNNKKKETTAKFINNHQDNTSSFVKKYLS